MPNASVRPTKQPSQILLIIGIVFIAINLRPALASVGPLIDDIRDATGLSNFMLGMLTTLPLIAFAVVSVFAPLFTKRFGIGGTLFGSLALLTAGILIRSVPTITTLYLGTLMLGLAIAFGNVLLPSLTKRNFSSHSGIVTGLYSSFMGLGAALSAGLSVPLAHQLNLGWRGSLGIWAGLAMLALLIWIPQLSRLKKTANKNNFLAAMKRTGKSITAWQVALFMGFQSMTFYVVLAWLPAVLMSRGLTADAAGWQLSLSQITGILGTMLVPYFAGKSDDQRLLVVMLIVVEVVALLGLMLASPQLTWLWVSIIGFVLGGSFGLSLLFIVLRSADTESATELSGMVQSVGYLIAAIGPVLFGSLFDLTGDWFYPFVLLITAAGFKLVTGWGAGKPGTV
jgi:CP family cyanate transporter-like MFS transporter